MSITTKTITGIGLLSFSMAANALHIHPDDYPIDLTISDVSSKDSTNPSDIQCILYGNSCPGGQQVMSARNYAQGGNVSYFDETSDPNQEGHKEDQLTNPYTVGYLAQFVGYVFEIGIDVNTAGGEDPERLLLFEVNVDTTETGDHYETKYHFEGDYLLDPAFNGNGFFDFTLSQVDLSDFEDSAFVQFRAIWDDASAGAENFFVWRGESVSVPEPSTIALMLAGLLPLLGAGARRRRQQPTV